MFMKQLNMDSYHPFKKMTSGCLVREIKEKKVEWPYFEGTFFDGKYNGRILASADVENAVKLWRIGYPELYGSTSTYDWVLYPERYAENVVLQESFDEDCKKKEHLMAIGEEAESGKIIGACLFKKIDENLQIEFSLGTIDPDYRQGKMGHAFYQSTYEYLTLIEESGAEYFTAFCETWHSISQFLCFKHWGMKIGGIFPGQYIRWCGAQNEYRGCTVWFYKFIGNGGNFVSDPNDWELIPEVKQLWSAFEEVNKGADDKPLKAFKNTRKNQMKE